VKAGREARGSNGVPTEGVLSSRKGRDEGVRKDRNASARRLVGEKVLSGDCDQPLDHGNEKGLRKRKRISKNSDTTSEAPGRVRRKTEPFLKLHPYAKNPK